MDDISLPSGILMLWSQRMVTHNSRLLPRVLSALLSPGHLVHHALLLCHFLPRCLLRSCRSTPFRDMSLPCTSYALPQGDYSSFVLRENSVTVELTMTDEKGVSIPLPQARLSRKVSTVWSRFGDVDFAGEWSATISSSNYQHLATEIFKERNDALSEILAMTPSSSPSSSHIPLTPVPFA